MHEQIGSDEVGRIQIFHQTNHKITMGFINSPTGITPCLEREYSEMAFKNNFDLTEVVYTRGIDF